MKLSVISIRSKIWLCVLIGLVGYLVATMASFYTNIKQSQNLSHLQEEHYPLAVLGSRLINTFELQTEEYEDAFMTGEQSLAEEANAFKGEMLQVVDDILDIIKTSSNPPVSKKRIATIREEYLAFAVLAENIYANPITEELSRDDQKKIRELGLMQGALFKGIKSISDQLDISLIEQIEKDKKNSLYTLLLLGSLFVAVLLSVGMIVDRVASELLITPLSHILDNIKRFSLGQRAIQPSVTADSDEIGHLAMAFWDMTEDLKTTTVSKKYVDNIIHNMSGALVVLKPDMTIQTINQQAIELFGFGEEELIGQQPGVLFFNTADDEMSAAKIPSIITDGQVKNLDTTCRAKDGRLFPAHFSGSSMYNEANELQGIICVLNDVTELKTAEGKLKEMAHYDPLTGLANRNLFFQFINHAVNDAKRHGRLFALLYLDLDKFKPINDTWGHNAGDQVLKEVGNRLQEFVRSDDTVARMGGDEFIVLLSGLTEAEDAERVAEKILQKILEPFQVKGSTHNLGISIGISVFPEDGDSMEALIAQADAAMYQAKNAGGNCFFRSIQAG
jgi:diguanylate cyclase (GGDEF)-like protein/PAS domain S-box-containing protein